MKFVITTTLAVLVVLPTRSFVWASPDPLRLSEINHGSQHEIGRREFMDYTSENLLERYLEEELAERDIYDYGLDLDARDLRDAVVDYLYARAARRAAQHAIKGFGDTAAKSMVGHAKQAATQRKPRTGGGMSRSRSKSPAGKGKGKIGAAGKSLPTRNRSRSKSPAGKGKSKIGSQIGAKKQFQKGSAKAAAKKGANAIIAKQKAGANGRKAAAKASKRK